MAYYPGPPRAVPPPSNSNTLVLVLVVVGAVLLVGGGSCVVCVGLAAVAADQDQDASASAANPATAPRPTSATSPTTAPSPTTADDPGPPSNQGDPPTPPDPNGDGDDTSSVNGRYACFQMRVIVGPNFSVKTQWVPGALPGFTITNGSYDSAGGGGRVRVSSAIVAFDGGAYGGWRGTTSTNSTGFFILFRGKDHADPQPGVGAKSGDYQCYRQR